MKTFTTWLRLAPLGSALLVGGCFAGLERNLDILLSPGAESNALALATSAVWPLLEAILRLVGGA